jgi:hypothetical protein
MRRIALIIPLLLTLLLGACSDVTGLGGRSLDGEWYATIDGEEVWVSLQDDRGDVWGDGDWGFDGVYVTGERNSSDVYLEFRFDRYSPVQLDGTVRGDEINGRLRGSGYDGVYVRFYRD